MPHAGVQVVASLLRECVGLLVDRTEQSVAGGRVGVDLKDQTMSAMCTATLDVRYWTHRGRGSKGSLVAVAFGELGGALPVAERIASRMDEIDEVSARRGSENRRLMVPCRMRVSQRLHGRRKKRS